MLTRDEIDAIAVPASYKPGKRPADMTQRELNDAAGSFAPRLSEYLARNADTGRRMVEAAGDRYGWTAAQRDAANAAYLLIPVNAIKGKMSVGTRTLDVLVAAAKRAA